ncbi:ejaculatory bulb-specific protein 3-like [Epargyreus clarus]|uniref:ejaculatory bulb-specific protein 3-like n=1 Tax=Epargyreus clarus TaxID=520877 RepID=UPI003C2EFD74
MRKFVICLVLTVVTLCTAEQYTDRYDNINIDEILENRRLLTPYVKCILDQGRCTPEGKELKLHIMDAMQTACKKCTETQRKSARKVVKHIRENEVAYWEEIKQKYDPKDEYKEIYEGFLAADD